MRLLVRGVTGTVTICILGMIVPNAAAAQSPIRPDSVPLNQDGGLTDRVDSPGSIIDAPLSEIDSPGDENVPSEQQALPRILVDPLDGQDGRDLSVRLFLPVQQLRQNLTPINRAAYPVVDVHTHFHYRLRNNEQALRDFVAVMDRNNIQVCVSLDGKLGSQLESHYEFLNSRYPNRFLIFANVDWVGDGEIDNPATWACHRQGFAERTAEQLRVAVEEKKVVGLKVFKRFGLGYRNPDGSLIKVDDPRFDPIWNACGELKIPILIHTADPAAFFEPLGPTNERWEELSRHPDWSFFGGEFPSRRELLDARNRLFQKHPHTIFIAAHVANFSEDLEQVSHWMQEYPNMVVELASRISELGRQDRAAQEFLIRYQDRVLFGTDGPWAEQRLRAYWRFLETFDESFDYSEKNPPPQGLWRIDGVGLPESVLRKIYYLNAARIVPGVVDLLPSGTDLSPNTTSRSPAPLRSSEHE